MRIKLKLFSIIAAWAQISFAGVTHAEWEIRLDAQRSPARLCKNLNKLTVWGHNLELKNTFNAEERTSNILYVGTEPVNDYYSPRRELAGAIRYGGQRGDRVWLIPSKFNNNYIEEIFVDPRFGPFREYCVYIPQSPMLRESFE